jgi:hypothetical protein
VNLIFTIHNRPDSDVKFPPFIKQWFFDILLNHTESSVSSRVDEMQHFIEVGENFYATALVHICGLHKPNILFAMFGRKFLS